MFKKVAEESLLEVKQFETYYLASFFVKHRPKKVFSSQACFAL